jgi:hypothetical protein
VSQARYRVREVFGIVGGPLEMCATFGALNYL